MSKHLPQQHRSREAQTEMRSVQGFQGKVVLLAAAFCCGLMNNCIYRVRNRSWESKAEKGHTSQVPWEERACVFSKHLTHRAMSPALPTCSSPWIVLCLKPVWSGTLSELERLLINLLGTKRRCAGYWRLGVDTCSSPEHQSMRSVSLWREKHGSKCLGPHWRRPESLSQRRESATVVVCQMISFLSCYIWQRFSQQKVAKRSFQAYRDLTGLSWRKVRDVPLHFRYCHTPFFLWQKQSSGTLSASFKSIAVCAYAFC